MDPLNEKELIKGKEYLIGRPKGDKVKAVYDPDDKKQFRRYKLNSGFIRHLHPDDRVYSVDGKSTKSRSRRRRNTRSRSRRNTRSRRNNNGNQHGI
jgi:hypothetical protein